MRGLSNEEQERFNVVQIGLEHNFLTTVMQNILSVRVSEPLQQKLLENKNVLLAKAKPGSKTAEFFAEWSEGCLRGSFRLETDFDAFVEKWEIVRAQHEIEKAVLNNNTLALMGLLAAEWPFEVYAGLVDQQAELLAKTDNEIVHQLLRERGEQLISQLQEEMRTIINNRDTESFGGVVFPNLLPTPVYTWLKEQLTADERLFSNLISMVLDIIVASDLTALVGFLFSDLARDLQEKIKARGSAVLAAADHCYDVRLKECLKEWLDTDLSTSAVGALHKKWLLRAKERPDYSGLVAELSQAGIYVGDTAGSSRATDVTASEPLNPFTTNALLEETSAAPSLESEF